MATNRAEELAYGSGSMLDTLQSIVTNHRAVGGDFPDARRPLIENLRTLQSALPAAIAEIEAAQREADG